jgi:hypothetical protein
VEDEPGHPVIVSGRLGVADRLLRHGVRLEPGRRPEVEIGDQTWLLALKFGPQEIPEQVMVAVPLTAAVEREYQQVPGFHLLEDGSGLLAPRSRRTEIRTSARGPTCG